MGSLARHILLSAAAGIAAKQNYSDMDILHFLTNVECLEGQFDTWGTFGYAVYLSTSASVHCMQLEQVA